MEYLFNMSNMTLIDPIFNITVMKTKTEIH